MTWRRVVQLALVHVGVSITVVPVTSTLNRIMIADMKMSAFLVSFLVARPIYFHRFRLLSATGRMQPDLGHVLLPMDFNRWVDGFIWQLFSRPRCVLHARSICYRIDCRN